MQLCLLTAFTPQILNSIQEQWLTIVKNCIFCPNFFLIYGNKKRLPINLFYHSLFYLIQTFNGVLAKKMYF